MVAASSNFNRLVEDGESKSQVITGPLPAIISSRILLPCRGGGGGVSPTDCGSSTFSYNGRSTSMPEPALLGEFNEDECPPGTGMYFPENHGHTHGISKCDEVDTNSQTIVIKKHCEAQMLNGAT